MNEEREKDVIDTLRILSLDGSEVALDLLLRITRDEAEKNEKDIGGIKVDLETYNLVVNHLKNGYKIKAIKVLREIFGKDGYGLMECKVAVESLKIIPQN